MRSIFNVPPLTLGVELSVPVGRAWEHFSCILRTNYLHIMDSHQGRDYHVEFYGKIHPLCL